MFLELVCAAVHWQMVIHSGAKRKTCFEVQGLARFPFKQGKRFILCLFEREARKTLAFKTGFTFIAGMYDHLPMYHGAYKFKKHYLGNATIPDCLNNEELECAKAIDEEPEVEFWLRNVDRQPLSFRLPTSTDWFYPDFLAQLCDI